MPTISRGRTAYNILQNDRAKEPVEQLEPLQEFAPNGNRNRRNWTPQKIWLLTKLYPKNPIDVLVVACNMGRGAINRKASELGLKKGGK